jgi:DNA helicase II / ATP-dependent DNA helicase PcrA
MVADLEMAQQETIARASSAFRSVPQRQLKSRLLVPTLLYSGNRVERSTDRWVSNMPADIPPRSGRQLVWTTSVDVKGLKRDGYTVWKYGDLRAEFITPARSVTEERNSLNNAAAPLLELLSRSQRLAVIGVPAQTLGDLTDIYGYLVEPAFRRNLTLLIQADRELETLEADELIDPRMRYPADYERLKYLARRFLVKQCDGLPPLTPIESWLLQAMRNESLTPQAQFGIGRYRADFAFPSHRLIVEADGRDWHDAQRDAARDVHLEQLGWSTIRFTGSEIYRDPPGVARQVAQALAARDVVVDYTPVEDGSRPWWVRLLDRLFHRGGPSVREDAPPPWGPPRPMPMWKANLDADQRRAVDAHEGVVQVIAPAGSGKTTVMISRVQELLSRGVPANRILCTTFNKAARDELDDRLKQVGVSGVDVRSFHALGRHILDVEQLLRSDIRTFIYGQWRFIARKAMEAIGQGVWLDAPVAADLISDYKLAKMWTPAEARARATTPEQQTAAEIYTLYEDELAQSDQNDFDDLILNAVTLLREDVDARRRWQARWDSILVDEYQDIEPAQELLIRLLAAPHDAIFAVGDEDQCIYSWRRASVERIVMLDVDYPGLERIVLGTSYRCPAVIVEAAKSLIENNLRRFPKQISHATTNPTAGEIICHETNDVSAGAKHVAALLNEHLDQPNGVVVLTRTTRLLQAVAQACAEEGIPFRAPERARRPMDSAATLLAYLRLAAMPGRATPDDVAKSCRVPNRYLPNGAEKHVAARLRAGDSFAAAVSSLNLAQAWRIDALEVWATLCADLSECDDGQEAIRLLRSGGGLDEHYASVEQMSPHDQVELDTLSALEDDASGLSVPAFVTLMEQREQLIGADNDPDGIELNTIHAAKGREWDTVIVFGVDDKQLPHLRAVVDAETDDDLRDALEDERRLLYVAITRTRQTLHVVTTGDPSPFLKEAGILGATATLPTLPSLAAIKAKNAQTADGNTPAPAAPAKITAKVIMAKYASTCEICQHPITPGTPIKKSAGNWVHASC